MRFDELETAAGEGLRDAIGHGGAPDLAEVVRRRRRRTAVLVVLSAFVATLGIGAVVSALGSSRGTDQQPVGTVRATTTLAATTTSTRPIAPAPSGDVTVFPSDCPAASPHLSDMGDGLPRKGATDEAQVRRQLASVRGQLIDGFGAIDAWVIPRNGQVWSGPGNGTFTIEDANDFQIEALLPDDAPCPSGPQFINGIPIVFSFDSDQPIVGFSNAPLGARGGHSVVWTGTEMIVWGGWGDELGATKYRDGAAYDPAADTWRRIAQAPIEGREYHNAVWTGDEMLVFGSGGTPIATAAAYEPATDTWRVLPDAPFPIGTASFGDAGWAWDGERLVAWNVVDDRVAAYSPADDRWGELAPTGIPGVSGTLRWDGSELYALSVEQWVSAPDLRLRRLSGDGWVELATAPDDQFSPEGYAIDPDPRLTAAVDGGLVAWTDSGDFGKTLFYDTGAARWREIAPVPVSASEGLPAPIVAGDQVVAFGYDVSGMFDPAAETWSTLALPYGDAQISVWTGSEIITWGEPCCYGSAGEPFTIESWRAPLKP